MQNTRQIHKEARPRNENAMLQVYKMDLRIRGYIPRVYKTQM